MTKNALQDFPYDEYRALLDQALDNDIQLVHHNLINGGFSFAWRRASAFAKGRMIEVAVTYCSPKDQFCRRVGAYHTLSAFLDGNTIMVPAGSEDSADVVNRLRLMFFYPVAHIYQ